MPRHLQILWDGTPLAGRHVLIHCYHGLGDTIQFIRFASQVRAIAAELTIWAQPALIPLLRTMDDVGRLLPLHDGDPGVERDVDIEVMELPHCLRPSIATLPAEVPYFHLPGRRPLRQGRRKGQPLEVGLVWQSSDWNAAARSIPVPLLQPLAALAGVRLHILQRGPALRHCPPGLGICCGSDDIMATAETMTQLDLVIAVDTMVAHLAGALAVPVWVLLAHESDWRWMIGRDDSPWYPSMRLFRQPCPGDWAAVIGQVCAALRRMEGAASLGTIVS
ncbi:MAG TPA: hypothetical protein VGM87_05425 [Roseomonas sp.]